jgi:Tfp pilus assembly protein PilX
MSRSIRPVSRAVSPWAPLLVLALAVPAVARAQVLYGSLTGHVTDATGAVLPGVQVSALNVGTGISKATTTDQAGVYLINDLQPGTYRVTIALDSFKSVVHENVRLDANTLRRADAQLAPANVTEAIEIHADRPIIQTDQGALQETQSAEQINDLPLTGTAGRNYQSLMQIVPGALMAGEQNSAAGSPQRSISFNVNGVSRLQNNTKLDGASIQYPWLPTNTAYVPSAEAIEEVSIVTNAYNAEQGIAGGAAINVIMKSGTNVFRTTAWGYDTNSTFRARDYFQTTAANPKDDLKQYGGNLGGPIVKNKLFFFTNWEHTNHTNSSPTRFYSLATEALRRGDFSATGVTIYDPASNPDPSLRTPFPGNVIPVNRIDLAAQEMINRMPLPTGAGFVNNYVASGDGVFTRDNVDVKVNYNASNRLALFGRYSISPSNIIDPSSLGAAGGDALNGGQVGTAPGRTQVAGFGSTYTLSPTMFGGRQCRVHPPAAGRGERRHQFELRTGRFENPRDQRPRPSPGRHSVVPDKWVGQPRQSEHRQSLPVPGQPVRGIREPPVGEAGALVPLRMGLSEPADQSLPAAGGNVPDGTRHFPVQWQFNQVAERTDACRHTVQ